jgi:hypothetical protein
MKVVEKERFMSQLTAPDFRIKAGKCYDTSELNMKTQTKTIYHNHLIHQTFPDITDAGCACGKYSEEQVRQILTEAAWVSLHDTIIELKGTGIVK